MSESNTATVRPWLGLDPYGKGLIKESWVSRPALARFLWRLEISFGIDEVEVDFLVHKPLPDVLELSSEDDLKGGCLLGRFVIDESVSEKDRYLDMQFQILKAWRNFQSAVGVTKPGILGEREWRKLKRRMKLELRRKKIEEFEDTHGLLQTARELRLNPYHDGGDSEYFICACPGHHGHRCYLEPATGQWFCGWCPRAGESPEELRAFHEENQS